MFERENIDLEHVDVEVDRGVKSGEEARYAGHVLHPRWPEHFLCAF